MADRVEITDEKSAREWLEKQDHQTQVWFAARCALRALPGLGKRPASIENGTCCATLRANLLAASASFSDSPKHCAFAMSAADAAMKALARSHSVAASSAHFAAQASAYAASAIIVEEGDYIPASLAVNHSGFWSAAVSIDANAPKNWRGLWTDDTPPEALSEAWRELKAEWGADAADWSFWIDWYEKILNGNMTEADWDLTFRIATDLTDADWEAGQARVAERISQIRAAFEVQQLANEVAEAAYLAQPGAPGAGHNNPPSLIDDDLPEKAPETIIWVAADALRKEASAPRPDFSRVSYAVGILIDVLSASGKWAWQKVDKAVAEAVGSFGKAFGTAAGASALAYVTGHGDKIAQLVDAVLRWLTLS